VTLSKRYIALYKPYGYLSQFTGEPNQLTLAQLNLPPNVYAAGRLDKDSEGLLLLTDDGPFKSTLLSPRSNHTKTYWAQVEGIPTELALSKLRAGVLIKSYMTKPCTARPLPEPTNLPPRDPPIRVRQQIPTSWLELGLTEGKNRQVRRMTAKVGYPTLRLLRIQIGRLSLGDLAPGQWREVNRRDIL
jgi:23S rRNA pseudouridine2457 synthase